MANLVDSHAHLDMGADPKIALREAKEHGVARIVAVGFDLTNSRRAATLARNHPEVIAAVGVHPHDAVSVSGETMDELAPLAVLPEVVAIGETGLDYYRDRSPRSAQRDAFIRHINLARAADLTLIVHSREAPEDTLNILKEHAGDLTVVLHCFSLYGRIDECVGRGYFMSVAGNVTFPNAVSLRNAVKEIPEDLILTETDSPWLTPVPYRGKPNSPANVRFIVEELATLRKKPAEDLAKQIYANFHRAFHISPS